MENEKKKKAPDGRKKTCKSFFYSATYHWIIHCRQICLFENKLNKKWFWVERERERKKKLNYYKVHREIDDVKKKKKYMVRYWWDENESSPSTELLLETQIG